MTLGSTLPCFYPSLAVTNTDEFCMSCHVDDTVKEWKMSKHYSNPQGVRAGCADCHVPREFFPKVMRKLEAAKDVYGQIVGTIDTPEKFEALRAELAEGEWKRWRASKKPPCLNCHHMDAINNPEKAFLRDMHVSALENGQICIDCHKGVSHKAPD